MEDVYNSTIEIVQEVRDYEEAINGSNKHDLLDVTKKMDHLNTWDFDVKIKQILSQFKITNFDQRIGNEKKYYSKQVIKYLFSLILLYCSFSSIKAQKSLTFPSEYIDFELDSNYFTINGIYIFKNRSEQISYNQIKFPFAVPTSTIDSIRLINLKLELILK